MEKKRSLCLQTSLFSPPPPRSSGLFMHFLNKEAVTVTAGICCWNKLVTTVLCIYYPDSYMLSSTSAVPSIRFRASIKNTTEQELICPIFSLIDSLFCLQNVRKNLVLHPKIYLVWLELYNPNAFSTSSIIFSHLWRLNKEMFRIINWKINDSPVISFCLTQSVQLELYKCSIIHYCPVLNPTLLLYLSNVSVHGQAETTVYE